MYNQAKTNGNLTINLFAPQIEPTQHVAIVGNQVLGYWDLSKNSDWMNRAIRFGLSTWMYNKSTFLWSTSLLWLTRLLIRCWHGKGENRNIAYLSPDTHHIINDENLQTALPRWRATALPYGLFTSQQAKLWCGDFHDLKLMVDWAKTDNMIKFCRLMIQL